MVSNLARRDVDHGDGETLFIVILSLSWAGSRPLFDVVESVEISCVLRGWPARPPVRLLLRQATAKEVADVHCTPSPPTPTSPRRCRVPWLRRLPLRSPTLPPALHTNLYIVGQGPFCWSIRALPTSAKMIAPCRPWPRSPRGHATAGILLTHHHYDHCSGLPYLRQRLGVPVYAHPATATKLGLPAGDYHPVNEGEVLPFGPGGVLLRHTPGHAVGHLCVQDLASPNLIVGDMVASVGSILIEVADGGDMRVYLQSLARLKALAQMPSSFASGRPMVHRSPRAVPSSLPTLRTACCAKPKVLRALSSAATPPRPVLALTTTSRTLIAPSPRVPCSPTLHKLRDEGQADEVAPGHWARTH